MVYAFRHHEYMHIKPVLIACLIMLLLIVAGVVAIYLCTHPPKDDTLEISKDTKKIP